MSNLRDQTTSTLPMSNSSKLANHDEQDELCELRENTSLVHKTPETVNVCEHKLKAKKQFTHLPVECQAAFDARHSAEDVAKCDECAILEDIVANKCEKCLFAQELVSQQSSRKTSETENLSENYSRRVSSSLKKNRAPPVPTAPPLPRTKTETESCPPAVVISPQENEQNLELAEKTNKPNITNTNMTLPAVIAQCSSIEVFKRGKKISQFAGSNVYVIQPTFKQTVRPIVYQASKGIQCGTLKRTSPTRSSPASQCKRKDDSEKVMKKCECFEDSDIELDSELNQKFSGVESSSDQEEGKKFKSKSRNRTDEKKRSVSIQCRIPRKHSRSKLPSRSKSKAQSKSASPTKTKISHQYDLKRSSLSDICIGPSESESMENSRDYSSTLSSKPERVESDTQIVIEEKIYVKCPPDSIRKKKITTGNKSILSGKSLASDIRSLLCDRKLSDTDVSSYNDQLIKEEMKSLSNKRSNPSDEKSSDKKFTSKKSRSPDKETSFSSRNSVSPDRRSHMSQLKSEHSDSGSEQSYNRSDHFDEKPSDIKYFDQSRVSDEKCVCFDEKSIVSQKDINGLGKSYSSFVNEAPEQSESDFCAAFSKKTDHLHHGQSHILDEKCVCFDEKSIAMHKRNYDSSKSYISFGSEASEQSENDLCAVFHKKNHFNNKSKENDAKEEIDSEYDFHLCSGVDSNLFQAHHSGFAARDSRIAGKQYKSLSEDIDIEAYKQMSKTASRGQTHSDSHTTVLFRIIDMSRISCVFITLIILIILFFVAMLAWRIIKDGK